ncbi:MAG: DUF2314 domain-containing protein [Pseudomonadota bacterium]
MMNRSSLKWITIALAIVMFLAFGIPMVDRIVSKGGNDFYSYDATHPEMVVARLSAVESLDHFQDVLASDSSGQDFFVDVRAFTEQGGYEVVRLMDVRFPDGDSVSGTVSHETLNPLKGGLAMGSRLVASQRDIVDWSYRADGKLRGNFSLRVLLELEDEAVQRDILAELHEDPVPK